MFYRSTSKTEDALDSTIIYIEKLAFDISGRNARFFLITGDFKATLTNDFINDTKTSQRAHVDLLTASCVLKEAKIF